MSNNERYEFIINCLGAEEGLNVECGRDVESNDITGMSIGINKDGLPFEYIVDKYNVEQIFKSLKKKEHLNYEFKLWENKYS